jgi:hypothetical protein
MRKLFVGLGLFLVAGVVYANCVTNTIIKKDGTMTVCTTCCYGTNCSTTCI